MSIKLRELPSDDRILESYSCYELASKYQRQIGASQMRDDHAKPFRDACEVLLEFASVESYDGNQYAARTIEKLKVLGVLVEDK